MNLFNGNNSIFNPRQSLERLTSQSKHETTSVQSGNSGAHGLQLRLRDLKFANKQDKLLAKLVSNDKELGIHMPRQFSDVSMAKNSCEQEFESSNSK